MAACIFMAYYNTIRWRFQGYENLDYKRKWYVLYYICCEGNEISSLSANNSETDFTSSNFVK